MPDDNCIALAVVADTHINSTVGLSAPTMAINGGEYRYDKFQRRLWYHWRSFWEEFGEIAKSIGATPVVVFNGDMVEADIKLRSDQIITRNKQHIIENAVKALLPAVDQAEHIITITGTEAHAGLSGSYEGLLANDFTRSVPDPETGDNLWREFRGTFGGVRFDIRHHPEVGMGSLPWTEKAAVMRLAKAVQDRYLEHGDQPPQVAVRAHVHRKGDSGDNYSFTRALYQGCWSLMTNFGRRIAARPGDIQGLIFICQSGEYQLIKRDYELETGRFRWKEAI